MIDKEDSQVARWLGECSYFEVFEGILF